MIIINTCYKNHKILEITKELLELKDILAFLSPRKISSNKFYIPNFSINIVQEWFLDKKINIPKLSFIALQELQALVNYNKPHLESIVKDKIKNISPFEIPIIYLNKRFDYGEFIPIYIGDDLNKTTLVCTEFKLSKKLNILTPIIYGHEVTHSLLEKNEFSITNYINYELVPMFIERILGVI